MKFPYSTIVCHVTHSICGFPKNLLSFHQPEIFLGQLGDSGIHKWRKLCLQNLLSNQSFQSVAGLTVHCRFQVIISEAFGAVAALVEEKRLAASKKRNLVGKDRLRIGTAVVRHYIEWACTYDVCTEPISDRSKGGFVDLVLRRGREGVQNPKI